MNLCRKTFVVCLLLLAAGCAQQQREKLYSAPPTIVPNTERLMKTPGYWISRHPCPDKIILTPSQIDRLNHDVKIEHKFTQTNTAFSGPEVETRLLNDLESLLKRKLYQKDGTVAGPRFYDPIRQYMNLGAIPDQVTVRRGYAVCFADQRLLPTDEPVYMVPGDIDFDEIQNNGLDLGTPVSVIHATSDGQWLYTLGPSSSGWVKAQKIALCAPEAHQNCTDSAAFVVVTSAKGEIYLNPNLTRLYDYVRMGATFPLVGKTGTKLVHVTIPVRNADGTCGQRTAYMRAEDVHEGFLPYTPRTIIRQAFKLLNSPYGWGDMEGEQDCSRFIQEIFATVGIRMPRNSSEQAEVGRLAAEFAKGTPDEEKLAVLTAKGVGGITLLRLDNHIMLLLGMVDGKPYAIHATWGYHQIIDGRDIVRVLNRVAVTDMSLGAGSVKGSLLGRLIKIRIVTLP